MKKTLALFLVCVLTVLAPPAMAGPLEDQKSPNVRLISNSRLGNLSDLAFWGDIAVAGTGVADGDPSNDGFILLDISDPGSPKELSRFACPNTGLDVSIWNDIVVLSAQHYARLTECSNIHPSARRPQYDEFADLLVIDISNRASPQLIGGVFTCPGGSHTHTLLPVEGGNEIVVYSSNIGCVRPISVPVHGKGLIKAHPELQTGHPSESDGSSSCHDITVFPAKDLAACAGSTVTELWDINDPLNPDVLSRIKNDLIEHQHSTVFSWDAKTLVLGEEKITTLLSDSSTCGSNLPLGALWFYDISDPTNPTVESTYQLPRPSLDGYCSAHYFSILPIEGRNVLTSGWYSGGTSVVDFTDATQPREIAHYKASPGFRPDTSVAYASYWYNGHVYVSNFGGNVLAFVGSLFGMDGPGSPGDLGTAVTTKRGFDVLQVSNDAFSSAVPLDYLNPQTQIFPADETTAGGFSPPPPGAEGGRRHAV